jgi:hypothetical protein
MWKSVLCAAAALASGVTAASYDDIPDIEVYGKHFFYTNNGSQLWVLSFFCLGRPWY